MAFSKDFDISGMVVLDTEIEKKNRENREFKEFSFEVQLRLCLFIM